MTETAEKDAALDDTPSLPYVVEHNIHQRLADVMRHIAYLRKTKQIDNKYWVVEHDLVTAKVRPWFLHFGITLTVTQIEGTSINTGKVMGTKELPILRYEGTYDVSFTNVDRPDDKVVERIMAHSEDTGDKAPGKCLSYAVKALVLKTLMIETGDREEDRVEANVEQKETAVRQRPQAISAQAQTAGATAATPESPGESSLSAPATPQSAPAQAAASQVEKTASDQGGAQPATTEPAPATKPHASGAPPASKAKIKFVRQKLAEHKVTEDSVVQRLGIANIDEMTEAECNTVIQWAAKKAAAK